MGAMDIWKFLRNLNPVNPELVAVGSVGAMQLGDNPGAGYH
jgi:hypothetical protein